MVCALIVICVSVSFTVSALIYYIYFRGFKKIKPKENFCRKVKKVGLLRMLFLEVPKRLILDRLTLDPNTFKEYGVHIVVGKQGRGKSMTVAYLLREWQHKYPFLNVYTNMGYNKELAPLRSLEELLTHENNGIYGEVDVIDELQNVLDCQTFARNFPPEFLSIITQQRKVRRCIIGTTQVFERLAKPIREQTYYLYKPRTFFGCFTWVDVYDVSVGKDGYINDDDLIKVKSFCFVHDDWLRSCYDSYKVIDNIKV